MVPAISQAATTTTHSHSGKPSPDRQNNGGRPILKNVPSPSHSYSTTTITSSSSSSSAILKTSKRYPSPLLSRATSSSLPNRSQSVDRRRPPFSEMSVAAKMLITSARSLSVSFQGKAFSLPVSKKKETTATPVLHRKPTPERRKPTPVRDQRENSKPVDLWPGASRRANVDSDCDDRDKKLGSKFLGSSLRSRVSLDLRGGDGVLELRDESKTRACTHSRLGSSDFTDSVSSGSTNVAQEHGEISKRRSLERNTMASAKFWQETNTRLRCLQDPRCSSPSSRIGSMSSKLSQSKRFIDDSPLVSSPRGMASPIRGAATRPASPSKVWATATSSQARALSSPCRVRNGVSEHMNAYNRSFPSILCFSADIREVKLGMIVLWMPTC